MARPDTSTTLAAAARALVNGACAAKVGEHIDLWNNLVQALTAYEKDHPKPRYVANPDDEE